MKCMKCMKCMKYMKCMKCMNKSLRVCVPERFVEVMKHFKIKRKWNVLRTEYLQSTLAETLSHGSYIQKREPLKGSHT